MKKRLTALFLVLCTAFSLIVPVSASSPNNSNQQLSKDNINHIEAIFEKGSRVELLNDTGEDVTQEMIDKCKQAYLNKDYHYIIDYIIENSLAIVWPEKSSSAYILNSVAKSRTITQYFDSPTGEQSNEWVSFHFEGSYQVDDYNGGKIMDGILPVKLVIEGAGNTHSFDYFFYYGDSYFTISGNKREIKFTVSYSVSIGMKMTPGLISDTQYGKISFYGRT